MAKKNSKFGGFRKPIKKGDIKTVKQGNLSLIIEGDDRDSKKLFMRYFFSLNRNDKRDLIRRQRVHARYMRKEAMKDGIGMGGACSDAQRLYNKRLETTFKDVNRDYPETRTMSYLGTIHFINELKRDEAEKRRSEK